MHILDEIVQSKRKEVTERKALFPVKLLEASIFFAGQCVSMRKYLQRPDKVGIIAEFKRKSPSKGWINHIAEVERTSIGYMQAGASGLSVLTDGPYFGGENEDLLTARKFNFCPILRKDFVVDEYQVIEAKSIGADAVLLIARILTPEQVKSLTTLAHELGMEVLLEIHEESELDHVMVGIDLVGINNRNLDTFETTIETSIALGSRLPDGPVKVTESGISDAETLWMLAQEGFEGFLIGEHFMKHARPEEGCGQLIEAFNKLRQTHEA